LIQNVKAISKSPTIILLVKSGICLESREVLKQHNALGSHLSVGNEIEL